MEEKRRVFKKIFIATVYSAIFISFGTGLYFLFRPAAVPPPPPAPITSPIEVTWSQAFVVGPNLYSVGAKIRNPNTNFGASELNYTFSLYDANGILLTALPGKSFIWPGESKYIILGGINLAKAPVKTTFQFDEPAWREVKNFKGVDLTVGNANFGKGAAGSGKFFSVDFTASNNTSYDLNKAYISAIVLDGNGLPIAAASTILEDLKSKERRSVSIPWFSAFSGTPGRVDLSISTNLWENPVLIGQ